MKRKIYRSEDIIIKDQPVEIIDDVTREKLRQKSLEARKSKSDGIKLKTEQDADGNVNAIEITCRCGEVIRIGLRYEG